MAVQPLPQTVQDAFNAFNDNYQKYENEFRKIPSELTLQTEYEQIKEEADKWISDRTIEVDKIFANYPKRAEVTRYYDEKIRLYTHHRFIREDLVRIQKLFTQAIVDLPKFQEPNTSLDLYKQNGLIYNLYEHVKDRLLKIKPPLEKMGYIASGDYFGGIFTSIKTTFTAHGSYSYVNCARQKIETEEKEPEKELVKIPELQAQKEVPIIEPAVQKEGFFDQLLALFKTATPKAPQEVIPPLNAPPVATLKDPSEGEKKESKAPPSKPNKKPPSPTNQSNRQTQPTVSRKKKK